MPDGARRLAEDFVAAKVEAEKLYQEMQAIKAAQTAGTASSEDAARLQELNAKILEVDTKAEGLWRKLRDMNIDPKALDKMDRLGASMGGVEAKLLQLQQQAQETGGWLSSAETAVVELAARLQGIAGSASVSDRRILDLNRELETLKARQKEPEAAGVGKLGCEEYDGNIARIRKINNAPRPLWAGAGRWCRRGCSRNTSGSWT